jgi:hypothetical protein
MNADDVGMAELEVAPGFVFETFNGTTIMEQMVSEKFEGHFLFQHAIVSQPDDAHPAIAERALQIEAIEDPLTRAKIGPFGFVSVSRH